MTDLITVRKNQPITTSVEFAKEFELAHNGVLRKIRDLTVRYSTVRLEYSEATYINQRKRITPMIEITRDGFMTLIMQYSGVTGVERQDMFFNKQQLFIKAFNLMEQKLLQQVDTKWLTAREQGKIARRETTDATALLIEHAIKQGSEGYKKTKMIYANVTRTTYRALEFMEHKKPKTRDMLDLFELSELLIAERMIGDLIVSEIAKDTHYKVIYERMKKALVNYHGIIKIGKK